MIDQQALRQLDAELAKHVMGLDPVRCVQLTGDYGNTEYCVPASKFKDTSNQIIVWRLGTGNDPDYLPYYTDDWEYVFRLVTKVRSDDCDIQIKCLRDIWKEDGFKRYTVTVDREDPSAGLLDRFVAESDSGPLAICLAIAYAYGIELPEELQAH